MQIVHYLSQEVDPQGLGVVREAADFAMTKVTSGRLELTTATGKVTVAAGEVWFTKALDLIFPFASGVRAPAEYGLVIFRPDGDLLESLEDLVERGPLTTKPGLGFSTEQLERRLRAGSPLMQKSAEHYLSSFLYNVADSGIVAASSAVMEQHLVSIISYMKEHLDQTISLDTIANDNNLSKTHLVRIFRKELGVTPMRYLTKLRVEKSSNVLLESDMKLEDVAQKFTFYSDSHFSKVFKKMTGENPSVFRHTYFDSLLSKQNKSRDELEKSYSFIQQLIDATEDLIFYKNKEGRYLGCNMAFCRFAGRAREDIVGRTDFEIFPPDMAEGFTYSDRKVVEDRKTHINEEWIRYKDNTKVLVEVSKSPFYWHRGEVAGLIGISRDITFRKVAEERLKVAKEEVTKRRRDHVAETLSALASISEVSAASLSFLALLRKEEPNDEKGQLIDEVIRQTRMIENLFRAFQGLPGEDDPLFEAVLFSLNEVVETGKEFSLLLFPRLSVEFEVAGSVPLLLAGPKGALEEMVTSLLMHIGSSGASRVRFGLSYDPGKLTLSVRDDAPPLWGNRPAELQSDEAPPPGRTWDLSLRHCHDIVDSLGGDWNIENTDDEVVFTLIMPIQRGLK